MTWHLAPDALERYAAGTARPAEASSVEAHVIACDVCRPALAAHADPHRVARLWDGVAASVDAPAAGPVESALVRVGVRDHVARLLAATPSLRLSWLAAVAVALAFAVAAAWQGSQHGAAFLFVAPLIPLAGVAVAFGPSVDPTYEVGTAAPMTNFRLLLIRSTAVVAATLVLSGLAALALPHDGLRSAAWLLPSLALATGTLALSSWMAPWQAGSVLGLAWTAGVLLDVRDAGLSRSQVGEALAQSTAFEPIGQAVFAAAALVAVLVLIQRQAAFDVRSPA